MRAHVVLSDDEMETYQDEEVANERDSIRVKLDFKHCIFSCDNEEDQLERRARNLNRA